MPRRHEARPRRAAVLAGDIITILREAHLAVEQARARGDTGLDPQMLEGLRERYDTAVSSGIIRNRLRDWDSGNHPGYALGTWLRGYKEQVFLFTRDFAVDWTNGSVKCDRAIEITIPLVTIAGCSVRWKPRPEAWRHEDVFDKIAHALEQG